MSRDVLYSENCHIMERTSGQGSENSLQKWGSSRAKKTRTLVIEPQWNLLYGSMRENTKDLSLD